MKIAAMIFVLIAALVLIALLVQSFKLLRKTQREQLEARAKGLVSDETTKVLHPKLREKQRRSKSS